ncbi:HAD family hydrolase [Streptomyces millisiae]|uniref:HAD family hydrolase n=1 Tax=Streptomyces millisiae TaxID=3075542 RepID=A0ABU2LLU9_9ACTN|nr:HAD family hydrolase [Streptomyces sp. DSM 44918]MDT0318556.1 HAD family hydrolase [Streptomyces sp. DSM 44918]
MTATAARSRCLTCFTGVRGVCFDLGGTLVRPDTLPTTGQVAALLGISLTAARTVMEDGAKRRRIAPDQLAHDLATTFRRPALAGRLAAVLREARERAVDPELFEETEGTLTLLRQRGFALFALTNSLGSSIPDQPPAYQRLLDAVVYSADCGAIKPERAAFAAIEKVSGLPGHELLHVGDSLRADAAGALAAGWHAAFLSRPTTTGPTGPVPEAAVLIRTLAALPTLLPAHPARQTASTEEGDRP